LEPLLLLLLMELPVKSEIAVLAFVRDPRSRGGAIGECRDKHAAILGLPEAIHDGNRPVTIDITETYQIFL